MTTQVDRALVLDRLPYGDNDAVVTLLTQQHGRLTVFARGARRRKPRFGAALEPYTLLEVEWRSGRTGDSLATLLRVELLDDHERLRSGLNRLLLAAFGCEAVKEACPEGEQALEVFLLLLDLLRLLSEGPASVELWLGFQAKLLLFLGYAPDVDSCVGCGASAPEGRSVLVDVERGGLLCHGCRAGAHRGVLLSGGSRAALCELLCGPLGRWEVPLGAERVAELRGLLPRLLERQLVRPLKSQPMLPF